MILKIEQSKKQVELGVPVSVPPTWRRSWQPRAGRKWRGGASPAAPGARATTEAPRRKQRRRRRTCGTARDGAEPAGRARRLPRRAWRGPDTSMNTPAGRRYDPEALCGGRGAKKVPWRANTTPTSGEKAPWKKDPRLPAARAGAWRKKSPCQIRTRHFRPPWGRRGLAVAQPRWCACCCWCTRPQGHSTDRVVGTLLCSTLDSIGPAVSFLFLFFHYFIEAWWLYVVHDTEFFF